MLLDDNYRIDLVGRTNGAVMTIDRRSEDGVPIPVYEWTMGFWFSNRLCRLLMFIHNDMDPHAFGYHDHVEWINKAIDLVKQMYSGPDNRKEPIEQTDLDLCS